MKTDDKTKCTCKRCFPNDASLKDYTGEFDSVIMRRKIYYPNLKLGLCLNSMVESITKI